MKLTWNGLRVKQQYTIFGIDDITAAMLIGTIASVATSAVAGTANTISQVKTNNQNQANLENAWERDDSALQRARADAQKAGFSPLAALSSNLTNTSPAMMQAPQFDSSGIVQSIQSGTQNYANYKAQKPLLQEQTRALRIENDFNKTNNFTKKLQNVANLAKSMRELDQLDLTNYEKASILVANGIPSSTVEKLIPHSNEKGVIPANQGSKYLNELQQAQTKLIHAQTSHEYFKIFNTQKDTVKKALEAERIKHDDGWLYKPIYPEDSKATIQVPVYNFEDGKAYVKKVSIAGKSRAEISQIYDTYTKNFENILKTKSENWNDYKQITDEISPADEILKLLSIGMDAL